MLLLFTLLLIPNILLHYHIRHHLLLFHLFQFILQQQSFLHLYSPILLFLLFCCLILHSYIHLLSSRITLLTLRVIVFISLFPAILVYSNELSPIIQFQPPPMVINSFLLVLTVLINKLFVLPFLFLFLPTLLTIILPAFYLKTPFTLSLIMKKIH